MPPKIQVDPVPQPVAGPMSIKCECGWEMVVIQPEEHMTVLTYIFHHLEHGHGISFPKIFCNWH